MDELTKIRLIAGAFIGGALYTDPLSGYVGNGVLGNAIEGGVAGLIGGDIAQAMTPDTGAFSVLSAYGKIYGVLGALSGGLGAYLGLDRMTAAGLGAASVLLDTQLTKFL